MQGKKVKNVPIKLTPEYQPEGFAMKLERYRLSNCPGLSKERLLIKLALESLERDERKEILK